MHFPSFKEAIGAGSILIALIQYVPYSWLIYRGVIRPHAFSRLIWGLVAGIAFMAQFLEGGGAGSWATGVTSFACFIAMALSLRLGDRNITRGDWIALVFALSAIPLWRLTNEPLYSVLLVTLIDGAGYYPAARKAWNHPHHEMAYAFTLGWLKGVAALFALERYTITTTLYPAFLVFADGLFVAMLLIRRNQLKRISGPS
ncbi:MAG: hypothetical protein JNM27_13570 [Leptospirales bacterium]|nr:hypothetical protein [Leptospirales bacterium]